MPDRLGRAVRVCLGGTFEPLHAGHEALLRTAALGADELFVGITEGKLASRGRPVSPWQERAAAVEAVLRRAGFAGKLTARALEDATGPAATGAYDRIVVSPETVPGALAINVARRRAGLRPLEVKVVPHVLGQDLLPVSGTAVAAGLVDAQGRRLKPVRVAVGSQNEVKVEAVRAEMGRVLGVAVEVKAVAAPTGVPEQPKGAEAMRGAAARADAARKAWPGCDYAVGIEAGLLPMLGAEGFYDVQACAVLDRTGWQTDGWGPAFHYPDWVTHRALGGEMVSAILGPVAGDPRIGSTTGAIGYLTDGRMDRRELTRIAVLMALVPRIRRALYVLPPP
jgi:inosine/xanthosine triphosphatase